MKVQIKAEVGEDENLLQKKEVGERPAARHPPRGILRESSNLRGCQMIPALQKVHRPIEGIQAAVWQGRHRECDCHSAKIELASPPTGSLP